MAGPIELHLQATTKIGPDGIKKYLAQDVRGWVRKDLAKECRRVFDIANKRINRLEASEVLSPALHAVQNSGGKFYTRGLDWNSLYREYRRCINFLNMETSSVTTARQHEKKIEQLLGGHKITDSQRKFLFKAYHSLEKASPAGVQAYGSERLIQYLAEEINSEDENIRNGEDFDFESYVENSLAELMAEYERVMAQFDAAFENTDIFSF